MSKKVFAKTYDTYDDAAEAVKKLLEGGVLKKYISVLAKGEQEELNEFEYKKENEDIIFWGEQGAFWGSLWGLLAGGVLMWVPGFGPLVATGRIIAALAGMIGGAATLGSISALTAWLVELGMEKRLAHRFENQLEQNKILVVVHGDSDAVKMAEDILN